MLAVKILAQSSFVRTLQLAGRGGVECFLFLFLLFRAVVLFVAVFFFFFGGR